MEISMQRPITLDEEIQEYLDIINRTVWESNESFSVLKTPKKQKNREENFDSPLSEFLLSAVIFGDQPKSVKSSVKIPENISTPFNLSENNRSQSPEIIEEEFTKVFQTKSNKMTLNSQSFCLCNLTKATIPSRNITFQLNDIDIFLAQQILSYLEFFGNIQNIDYCNFDHKNYYDLNSSIQAYQEISQNPNSFVYFKNYSYLMPFNDFSFIDFVLKQIQSCYNLYKIRFFDSRVPTKIKQTLKNFSVNQNDELIFFKKTLNLSENQILNILQGTNIVEKSTCTEIFLKLSEENQSQNYDLSYKQQYVIPFENIENKPKSKEKKTLKITSTDFDMKNAKDTVNFKFNNEHKENFYFFVSIQAILEKNDKRTTIMIKNIPNRYNQQSLLQIINLKFKGLYDFFYLPMDFKNKCNIGYAFLNFVDPKYIIEFYKTFDGKKWDNLRSEKICAIRYARIQGRYQLIKHFQKSNIMHIINENNFKPLILPNPFTDFGF